MSDPLALRAAQEAILASGSTLAGPGGLCGPCVELLPVTGAAVCTLSGPINNETVCASDDVAFRIDELQFDLGEGPCWEAFASRRPVLVPDLRDGRPVTPWPVFNTAVRETSAAALFAFPLYVGATGIGALDLYRSTAGPLDEEALAEVATIGVLQERAVRDGAGVDERLQFALNSRVVIEQAKGVLAQHGELDMDQAFVMLRGYARRNHLPLTQVGQSVVDRELRPAAVLAEVRSPGDRVIGDAG